ncbi:hypothetical protein FYZ48_16495 [Gimesia chilikensis]|uniref:hypothetical protein n=1 Tax=Gimesia chilikensis TaxID=2605989 RepID=UPI0011ECC595|nr:hypothetical protein [Gimesia chilikensis]KAA0137033.1 hypothetical protein FYZ48_16495 [Gimesia chilikensis]
MQTLIIINLLLCSAGPGHVRNDDPPASQFVPVPHVMPLPTGEPAGLTFDMIPDIVDLHGLPNDPWDADWEEIDPDQIFEVIKDLENVEPQIIIPDRKPMIFINPVPIQIDPAEFRLIELELEPPISNSEP